METFAVGIQIAKVEGIIPAPEANPAVVGAIREALRWKGRADYNADEFRDYEYPEEEIVMALAGLPSIPSS